MTSAPGCPGSPPRPGPPSRPSSTSPRPVADTKGATPGQVALAWLLAKQPWIVPIPGTRHLERLEENLGATGVDLTPEDVTELDQASARIQVQGERYPEAMQAMIDR